MNSFILCTLFVSMAGGTFASSCQMSETCGNDAYSEQDTNAMLDAVVEDAGLSDESLTLLQARTRIIPDVKGQIIYMLEAYLTEFRDFGIETCSYAHSGSDTFDWVRMGYVGDVTTGCMNLTTSGDWFANSGFNDSYSVRVGTDPELMIQFEAYEDNMGDPCSHDEGDPCHVYQAHRLSASEITTINQWIPGKLGDAALGHEMYYTYRLSIWTTTTSTTTTTTTTTSTTTTTTTTTIFMAECKVFGDPHIIGFDKGSNFLTFDKVDDPLQTMDNFDRGDFWLVKSPLVHIQGRYNVVDKRKQNSYLRVLAVGGPFLKNNTLIIGNRKSKVLWNKQTILEQVGSEFRNKYMIAKYHSDSKLVQDFNREAPGTDIQLPLHVSLLVNRGKNGVGVMITMPKFAGGQDGQCGNFNGISDDDTKELIASRMGGDNIYSDELLFHNKMVNP